MFFDFRHGLLERVLESILEVDVRPPLGKLQKGKASNLRTQPVLASVPIKEPTETKPPFHADDLDTFAQQLTTEGFDARANLFNGQVGLLVGPNGLDPKRMPPDIAGLFFPLWELNHEVNRPLVVARNFHDLVANRPQDWKFDRPYRDNSPPMLQGGVVQSVSDSHHLELRLLGPNDLDLVLERFPSKHPKHGLIARLHNRRHTNVSNASVIVRDVRSFDAAKSLFREKSGFKSVRILKQSCAAGFEGKNVCFLRIEADHLEVGESVNDGVMSWPTGDKSNKQMWRLSLSVTAEGHEEWMPELDIEWVLRSETVRVQVVQPEAGY